MERKCEFCGKPESEHHEFRPHKLPKGCVCGEDGSWNLASVPEICNQFVNDEGDGYCVRCEHNKECHSA